MKIPKKFKYLNLIKELAITDFKLKYQGSFLGYLWSLISPLAYFAVLYVVFTKIFKVGAEIPYYPIYLLLGVMIFGFWSEATTLGMYSIASKGDLIRKVYFPRIVLVVSSTATSLLTFFLNMIVLFGFAYFTGVRFSWSLLTFVLLIFELYIFIMGVSFYLAALFVKFRDVGHIWQVFNQILFYATPIVYSMTLVPVRFGKIMMLSPLTQVIQDARAALIGIPVLSTRDYWGGYFLIYVVVGLVFISGYFLFQKMAAKFAEEV